MKYYIKGYKATWYMIFKSFEKNTAILQKVQVVICQ